MHGPKKAADDDPRPPVSRCPGRAGVGVEVGHGGGRRSRLCLGGRWIPTDDSFSEVANSAGLPSLSLSSSSSSSLGILLFISLIRTELPPSPSPPSLTSPPKWLSAAAPRGLPRPPLARALLVTSAVLHRGGERASERNPQNFSSLSLPLHRFFSLAQL